MPSNFQVNKNDLDNIFKPLYTFTNKVPNVGLSSGVVDISNYYEKTKNPSDRYPLATGYLSGGNGGVDLNTLFQARYYFILTGTILSKPETKEKYYRAGNGQIIVSINPTYAKSVNKKFTFFVQIQNTEGITIASAQQSVADSTTSVVTITISGLYGSDKDTGTPYNNNVKANDNRIDYVTVRDVNSGWTSATLPITVGYGTTEFTVTF
jgi:hypothetical protein